MVTGGIIGAIGWCGYWEMWSHGQSVFMSSLVCSLLLANTSQICAIKFKNPLTVYFVPGLVPVVPGVTIYDAFRTLLLDEYSNSARIFLNSFYGAIGLAVGIIIADSIFRVIVGPMLQKTFTKIVRKRIILKLRKNIKIFLEKVKILCYSIINTRD